MIKEKSKQQNNNPVVQQKIDSVINHAITNISNRSEPLQCGGRNCVYNITSSFGDASTTKENKDFVENLEKYGFKFVKASNPNSPYDFTGIQPGDMMIYWRTPNDEKKPWAKAIGWVWTKNPFNSAYIPKGFEGYYPHHAALIGNISNDSTSAIIHDTDGENAVRHRDFKTIIAPRLRQEDLGYRTFYRFQGTPEQLKQWNDSQATQKKQAGGNIYYLGISNNQKDSKFPVGHGGLVYVDKDGLITIYDSGPFYTNNTQSYNNQKTPVGSYSDKQSTNKFFKYLGYGAMNYRQQHPNFKAEFNTDGTINLDKLAYDLKTLHYKYGENGNKINLVAIPNLDVEKTLKYFNTEASDPNRKNYNIFTNSCSSAACRALNAGTNNKYMLPTKMNWPSSFSFLPDVIDAMEKIEGVKIVRKSIGGKLNYLNYIK